MAPNPHKNEVSPNRRRAVQAMTTTTTSTVGGQETEDEENKDRQGEGPAELSSLDDGRSDPDVRVRQPQRQLPRPHEGPQQAADAVEEGTRRSSLTRKGEGLKDSYDCSASSGATSSTPRQRATRPGAVAVCPSSPVSDRDHGQSLRFDDGDVPEEGEALVRMISEKRCGVPGAGGRPYTGGVLDNSDEEEEGDLLDLIMEKRRSASLLVMPPAGTRRAVSAPAMGTEEDEGEAELLDLIMEKRRASLLLPPSSQRVVSAPVLGTSRTSSSIDGEEAEMLHNKDGNTVNTTTEKEDDDEELLQTVLEKRRTMSGINLGRRSVTMGNAAAPSALQGSRSCSLKMTPTPTWGLSTGTAGGDNNAPVPTWGIATSSDCDAQLPIGPGKKASRTKFSALQMIGAVPGDDELDLTEQVYDPTETEYDDDDVDDDPLNLLRSKIRMIRGRTLSPSSALQLDQSRRRMFADDNGTDRDLETGSDPAAAADDASLVKKKKIGDANDDTSTEDLTENMSSSFGHLLAPKGARVVAVAKAVSDDDLHKEDDFEPRPSVHAVEYDPDTKPYPFDRRHRRAHVYVFLAIVVVTFGTIGVVFGVSTCKKDDEDSTLASSSTTAAPSTFRQSLGIRNAVRNVVGEDALQEPDSPYSKALEWITSLDPMQVTPEAPNFIQRYIASYLYFATTVDGPWRSCNPPDELWGDEVLCVWSKLGDIDTLGFSNFPSHAWLSNSSECTWAGLECNSEGQVRILDMGELFCMLRRLRT